MKLIITEGGKDALTLGEAGYPFVISVPNGAAGDLHKSFEAFDPWLDYAQSIVIYGDTDLPGRSGPSTCPTTSATDACSQCCRTTARTSPAWW